MPTLIQKDSKNRVSLGTKIPDTYFERTVDSEGRIIFTPMAMVPKNSYQEKIIVLSDHDRDRFVEALLKKPMHNSAYKNAQKKFREKYK